MSPDAADEWAMLERPFVVHSFNIYWLMYFAADHATRPAVTAALVESADAGPTSAALGRSTTADTARCRSGLSLTARSLSRLMKYVD
jgi:hypothetical protein